MKTEQELKEAILQTAINADKQSDGVSGFTTIPMHELLWVLELTEEYNKIALANPQPPLEKGDRDNRREFIVRKLFKLEEVEQRITHKGYTRK